MRAKFALIETACTLLTCLGPASAAWAQSNPAPVADASQESGAPALPIEEIEGIVAPVALYPDVLLSQVLPAATFPTEIVMASRWVAQHPDLEGLEQQEWDPSVLSICRYPSVLDKMNTDLDWTNALGAAFLNQPDDVFDAIQTLRKQAQDADILKDTPQQKVVEDQGAVRIVPAEKDVIYVPQYNPQIIYVDNDDDNDAAAAVAAGAIGFGVGLAMGAWLDNDCDWHGHVVYGCRPGYWGGWGWHGRVNWDNDWYAFRGPRRGFVKGEHGGVAWGPNGRAVWGEHGAGAWRRPSAYVGRPAYTGRYRSAGNFSGNRRTNVSGNTFNRNNVNVNIDRGDRARVGGGDRTNIRGGDRTRTSDRRYTSELNDRQRTSQVNRTSDRGARSRDIAASRPNSTVSRSNRSRPSNANRSRVDRSSSRSRGSGAFSNSRSRQSTQRSSNRGRSSRGGGHRSGGGRGGRRR